MEVEGYRLVKGTHSDHYTKDKRFVKAVDVPQDIRSKLEIATALQNLDPHICIFCGAEATESRFVNQQTIALCSEDYYAKNIGHIVMRLKEIYHEKTEGTGEGDSESTGTEGDDGQLPKTPKVKRKRRSNRRTPKQTSKKAGKSDPVPEG